MDHEALFIDTFILPGRRDRYRLKLAVKKSRRSFLSRLYHNLDYIPELSTRFHPSEQTWDVVHSRLQALGAPETCYCISANIETDQRFMPLEETLRDLVLFGQGYVLSCIPGRLAYYQAEETDGRFVLHRPWA